MQQADTAVSSPLQASHAGQQARAARPLEGVRVLDFSRYVAGPHCTMLLAAFGADVIKIERPERGEDLRGRDPSLGGENLLFASCNRSKRSVAIDLYSKEGIEAVKKLAAEADVLVENFRAGTLEKMGLDVKDLHAVNPRLVVTRISGFGQSGPYVHRVAFDAIAQAMSGWMHLTGSPDGPPMMAGTVLGDYTTALYATIGTMMALRSRDQTGIGQVVEATLLGSASSLLMGYVAEYTGLGIEGSRAGNRDKYSFPCNAFQTSGGEWIQLIASTDTQFVNLMRAVGRPELGKDPRYSTVSARAKTYLDLEQIVGKWIKLQTLDVALAALDAADVPHAQIATIPDLVNNPQVRHSHLVDVTLPSGDEVSMIGVPIGLSRTPAVRGGVVPGIGEHTEQVLKDWLKLSDVEIRQMKDAKAF